MYGVYCIINDCNALKQNHWVDDITFSIISDFQDDLKLFVI